MSEYIPFEIQVEVIKRLPVKSLLQFRSVSKPWKSLIDSSEFITGYKVRQTHPQQQRLLVWYKDPADNKGRRFVSFVDDDDEVFPQPELGPTFPMLSNLLDELEMVGSSQGLLCFYCCYQDPGHPRYDFPTEIAVVWNPSIRKSVCITVPGAELDWSETVLGFGVCPITSDPTIVKFTNVSLHNETKTTSPPIVEVFTLSRGSWRIPSGSSLPKKSIQVTWSQVVIDGYIYWLAFDNDLQMQKNLIISFDMTTEEFRVIDLPDILATATLSISKVWNSLAVLDCHTSGTMYDGQVENYFDVCDVWIMEDHAVPNSFTKLFTINDNGINVAPNSDLSLKIVGFTKSGKPIMEKQEDYREPAVLAIYEPSSQHFNDIGIHGECGSFVVSSYMESLLLLDKSDCTILF